jgi:class 3 adenylate cyclase/tetratricopeptide (TPR) repeat protein
MFIDLVESTALAERLDPEDLREVVRDYQYVVSGVVDRYLGHIAQYLGDGLLVYFGYPTAHEDDARRAVLAGLEIIDSITRLNERLSKSHDTTIEIRIGLHTGPVVTGQIGTGTKVESLALGSTPNVAARIQSLTPPGQVYFSASSYDLVSSYFDTESIGEVKLRGLGRSVHIFRALRISTKEDDQDQHPPFVGRDKEAKLILSAFEEAASNRGQQVLIKGEAGIGKTRLQREVRNLIDPDQAVWLVCRCSAYHKNTALHPVINGLERLFGFRASDGKAERREKIEARIGDNNSGFRVAAIASLLSLGEGGDPATYDRERTFEVLVELITERSDDRTTVFSIEDLHWADPSTLEFLAVLSNRVPSTRTLMIASCRPEFRPEWPAIPEQLELVLDRLSDRECSQMLEQWSISKNLPFHLQRQIAGRTDGIPLFLEEVARTLHNAGDPLESSPKIPVTLRDSLTSRLDSLGPAKAVAQLGALLGRQFDYEILAATANVPPSDLDRFLQQLVDKGVLMEQESEPRGFIFRHSLIQENAYESLLRRHRKVLHRRVAEILEVDFPQLAMAEPETMARHCELAERYDDALDYYRRAASVAHWRWGYAESIHCYHRALELLDHQSPSELRDQRELDLRTGIAAPLFAHSGYTDPELAVHYNRAAELIKVTHKPGLEFSLMVNVWGYHCVRGDHDETVAYASRLEALATQTDQESQLAIISFVQACTNMFLGNQARAIPLFEHAVAYYLDNDLDKRQNATQHPLFLCWAQSPWSLTLGGYPDRALTRLDDAWAVADRTDDPLAKCQVLSYRNAVYQDLGMGGDLVLTHAEEIITIASEQGLATELQYGRFYRAWARAMQGNSEALDDAWDAIREGNRLGTLATWGRCLAKMAWVHYQLEQIDQAMSAADKCLEVCRTNLGRLYEADALRIKGDIYAKRGEPDSAADAFTESISLANQQGSRWFELKTLLSFARLEKNNNQDGKALEQLKARYDCFTEGFMTPDLLEAESLLNRRT